VTFLCYSCSILGIFLHNTVWRNLKLKINLPCHGDIHFSQKILKVNVTCWVIFVYLDFVCLFVCFIALLKADNDSEAVSAAIIRLRTQIWNLICWVLSMEPISVPVQEACTYRNNRESHYFMSISEYEMLFGSKQFRIFFKVKYLRMWFFASPCTSVVSATHRHHICVPTDVFKIRVHKSRAPGHRGN